MMGLEGRGVQMVRPDSRHTTLIVTPPSHPELASDVQGLRLYLVTALGDCYQVRVGDDGSVIGLWRRGLI
jgi:hypothetical protein